MVADALREGEHPLAPGHAREHAVHEVRGRVVHAARGARRADAPTLARAGEQVHVAAALADHAREAPVEPAAVEVGAQLLLLAQGV